jgi:hypothetical protein
MDINLYISILYIVPNSVSFIMDFLVLKYRVKKNNRGLGE